MASIPGGARAEARAPGSWRDSTWVIPLVPKLLASASASSGQTSASSQLGAQPAPWKFKLKPDAISNMITGATIGFPNMTAVDAEAGVAVRRASKANEPAPAPSGPGQHPALTRSARAPIDPKKTHEVRRPTREQAEQVYEEAIGQLQRQVNFEGGVWIDEFRYRFGHLNRLLLETFDSRPDLFLTHSYDEEHPNRFWTSLTANTRNLPPSAGATAWLTANFVPTPAAACSAHGTTEF